MLNRLRTRIDDVSQLRILLHRQTQTFRNKHRSRQQNRIAFGTSFHPSPPLHTYATKLVNGTQMEESEKERVEEKDVVTELEESYLAYSMSVLRGRSLPDVRDGLKPVHRRILYGMHELRMTGDKPYKKSARVVGEVLGKFHPHGDTAVYDAMVRMAQDFSMRYTLVDGHGNFGSIDHDPPAAMRYTECKLRPLTSEMMLDHLEHNTVDFMDTFDASEKEPIVLPAKVPQLLINGCQGIAVSMATRIPPHNMREIVEAMKALIKNPELTSSQLMKFVPAPDFPTGGVILRTTGLEAAYSTGNGSILMRGKVQIKKEGSRSLIIISELPYSSNKAKFVKSIAQLVDKETLEGISNVSDESDRDGMRIVVEVKKNAIPQVVLNNLYKRTSLQSQFACNMIAIVNGRPEVLNLKQFLEHFIKFRVNVVTRRSQYLLKEILGKLQIVEAILKALDNLEEVIKILKGSQSVPKARSLMIEKFGFTQEQSSAIASMPLSRLTIAEYERLSKEKNTLEREKSRLEKLLASDEKIMKEVATEAEKIASKYGDDRRSVLITDDSGDLVATDVIPNDPTIITFSKKGYIKRVAPSQFSVQRRGGRGVHGAKMRGDDTMNEVLHGHTHDKILFFTNTGKVFSRPAYEIPRSSRTAVGAPIGNILKGLDSATITSIFVLHEGIPLDNQFLLMATKNGRVKRTELAAFAKIRGNGLIATKLLDDDELRFIQVVPEDASVMIASNQGRVLRFNVDKIRPTSRSTRGVKGMKLIDGEVVGMVVLPHGVESEEPDELEQDVGEEEEALNEEESVAESGMLDVFMVTARGIGKRTQSEKYPTKVNRGSRGCIGIRLRQGDELVSLMLVSPKDQSSEVLLASKQGMMTRIRADSVRKVQRVAYGVKVMNMKEGDTVTSVTTVLEEVDA